jgi:hypothetical protein
MHTAKKQNKKDPPHGDQLLANSKILTITKNSTWLQKRLSKVTPSRRKQCTRGIVIPIKDLRFHPVESRSFQNNAFDKIIVKYNQQMLDLGFHPEHHDSVLEEYHQN